MDGNPNKSDKELKITLHRLFEHLLGIEWNYKQENIAFEQYERCVENMTGKKCRSFARANGKNDIY